MFQQLSPDFPREAYAELVRTRQLERDAHRVARAVRTGKASPSPTRRLKYARSIIVAVLARQH